MSDSVDRVFVHALNTVKRIPRSGSARPPLPERLRLYGLYKQSMEGDVEGVMDRPVDDETDLHAEREKWDAWYAQRHLSRTEAKRQYITALLDTMNKYASSTPEARELISELEFVWDQIKSNSSSSHSSGSPIHTSNVSQPQRQPSRVASPTPPSRSNYGSQYGSIGGRISRGEAAAAEEGMERPIYAGRDSRLRVLSPVSQPDDEVPGSGRRNYKAGDEHGAGPDGDRLEEKEDEDEEDDEDEEEFQEARDSPFEDDDDNENDDDDEDVRSDNNNNHNHNNGTQQQPRGRNRDRDKDTPKPKATTYNRRWRRRVEQAMTKMTAELAAMREQMETRAINSRRRSSLWAWIKWLVWVVVRQVCWDLVLFGCLLVWMRVVRGDRRLEEKVSGVEIWKEVRRRVALVIGRGERRGLGFRLGGFP
ncbi:acyl CoA binding protein [Blastomyces dermatitidis ER-3]|uniref:Acyl CoA binding protein n=4 Tax=Ajellomyces dermatitidis TaxID=5039 RepID=F2TT37_AJEDA|nr:acyl CoA binding protein [Blastomyces dermatitidis ER-3]EGE86400.1 acyl CoA binding protein [Blastomyces dermatitidis ATCC 18188]OAT02754.1 acyl CoA binding protein [Blastomyces dermatitidis ER-3]